MKLPLQMEELVEARKAAAFVFESDEQYALAVDILAGRQDYISQVQAALMAYTAGHRAGCEQAKLIAENLWSDMVVEAAQEADPVLSAMHKASGQAAQKIATAISSISEQETSRG